MISLAAGVFYAFEAIIFRFTGSKVNNLAMTTYMSFYSTLFFVIFSNFKDQFNYLSLNNLSLLLLMGVCGTIG